MNETAVSGTLTYTARVTAGGVVDGRMALGHGTEGELNVSGNFGDGSLVYRGWVIQKTEDKPD